MGTLRICLKISSGPDKSIEATEVEMERKQSAKFSNPCESAIQTLSKCETSSNMVTRQKINKNHGDFDGFAVIIFLDEDGDYLAHLVELPNVSACGPTTVEALVELKEAWELMKECYEEDGVPVPKGPWRQGYEGPVNIPVNLQLYHALTNEAAEARTSIYVLVEQKLKSTESVVHEGQKGEGSITNLLLNNAI